MVGASLTDIEGGDRLDDSNSLRTGVSPTSEVPLGVGAQPEGRWSTARPRILLIGTLDTKGVEVEYVRGRIRELGAEPVVLDPGILLEASGCVADIPRAEVADAAGVPLDDVRAVGSRGAAVEIMERGVAAISRRLWSEGRLHGVICIGGAEGALLGAAAMHALPLGVPKVIVTPVASGRRPFGPFTGTSDVLVMHSVIDILGLNPISKSIFDNAAAAIVGMVRDAGRPVQNLEGQSVGVTMVGQTTPGVMKLRDALEVAGHHAVIFHANGVGGPAMEELVVARSLAGVIDYTLGELADTLMDGVQATGPERLRVAGQLGLPQVVVPGCVDFFVQGASDTLSEEYRRRKTYHHNPMATLVRLESDEMAQLGRIVAERLNEANGPVHVVAPTRGFSISGTEGGALWDPEADRAFLDSLAENLRDTIPLELVNTSVNDPAFAALVAERYVSLVSLKEDSHGAQIVRPRRPLAR